MFGLTINFHFYIFVPDFLRESDLDDPDADNYPDELRALEDDLVTVVFVTTISFHVINS